MEDIFSHRSLKITAYYMVLAVPSLFFIFGFKPVQKGKTHGFARTAAEAGRLVVLVQLVIPYVLSD